MSSLPLLATLQQINGAGVYKRTTARTHHVVKTMLFSVALLNLLNGHMCLQSVWEVSTKTLSAVLIGPERVSSKFFQELPGYRPGDDWTQHKPPNGMKHLIISFSELLNMFEAIMILTFMVVNGMSPLFFHWGGCSRWLSNSSWNSAALHSPCKPCRTDTWSSSEHL